ncbi:hypothetical protein [Streptomyces sp. NPDC021356]|uniref:hypothetical protein n=1 Tax=Streptomyces sp. NPDC021356 TaxID=3154900 RepID=UPI00340019D2
MRSVPESDSRPCRLPGRVVAVCGALALLAARGRGTADDGEGGAPGAPTGVTAAAGSATSVHVMWNAVASVPGIRAYRVARDAAGDLSPAGPAVRVATPGSDDGRGTAPTVFQAATHRADGAYYLDLDWVTPRTGGEVTEYQVQLDGRPATSLVWGGPPPRGKASYSFCLGRGARVSHRARLRARLPDGTWAACRRNGR